jgi:hypothetical protein
MPSTNVGKHPLGFHAGFPWKKKIMCQVNLELGFHAGFPWKKKIMCQVNLELGLIFCVIVKYNYVN